MKQVFLSLVLCLSAFSFLKAQGTSLAISEQTFPLSSATVNTNSLDIYCGTYKMQDNPYIDKVQITLKDGELVSKSSEDEDITLVHTENDEFFIAAFNARVIFTREKDTIKSVKVIAQGKEMIGEKL